MFRFLFSWKMNSNFLHLRSCYRPVLTCSSTNAGLCHVSIFLSFKSLSSYIFNISPRNPNDLLNLFVTLPSSFVSLFSAPFESFGVLFHSFQLSINAFNFRALDHYYLLLELVEDV